MIQVIGTVKLAPGAYAKLIPAAQTMIAETLKEDGCIRYAFSQDIVDPTIMHIAEAWRDVAALMVHGKAPHMAVWRAAVGEAGVEGRDLRMYDTDEGKSLG